MGPNSHSSLASLPRVFCKFSWNLTHTVMIVVKEWWKKFLQNSSARIFSKEVQLLLLTCFFFMVHCLFSSPPPFIFPFLLALHKQPSMLTPNGFNWTIHSTLIFTKTLLLPSLLPKQPFELKTIYYMKENLILNVISIINFINLQLLFKISL